MSNLTIQSSINIMQRVIDNDAILNQLSWQCFDYLHEVAFHTEKSLLECGTVACFGGWVAVSPEFQRDGGTVDTDGAPIYKGQFDASAIAQWLGIPIETSRKICCIGTHYDVCIEYYNVKHKDDITPQMVIDKLRELLD